MADTRPAPNCPECGSKETRAVESQFDEIPVYECSICGFRFEAENDS